MRQDSSASGVTAIELKGFGPPDVASGVSARAEIGSVTSTAATDARSEGEGRIIMDPPPLI